MKQPKNYTLLAFYTVCALIISGVLCDYDNLYKYHDPNNPNNDQTIYTDVGLYQSPEDTPYRTESATFVKDNILYSWSGRQRDGAMLNAFDGFYIDSDDGELKTVNPEYGHSYSLQTWPVYFTLGCKAVLLSDNSRVLFFGGVRAYNNGSYYMPQSNDMYIVQYDFADERFYLLNTTNANGAVPRNTKSPTVTMASNGKIYIYGGTYTNATEAEQAQYDYTPVKSVDMSVYDPESDRFSPIPVSEDATMALAGIATALPDGRIVYFQNTKISGTDGAKFLVAVFDTSNNSTIVKDLGQHETTEQYYKEYEFGFLGPDQSTIYYYGGVYNYNSRVKAHNSFGALDTLTWTWSSPKLNVTNEIPRRRYEFVAAFLNNSYLLVGLGRSEYQWFTQFDVLRISNDTDFDSTTYAWIPNIAYVDAPVDTAISGLSKGAIAGIVIGSVAFAAVVFAIMWKYFDGIKATFIGIHQGVIYIPRLGEPRWAEISHTINKLVFTFLFIAYITYSIIMVLDSPIASTTMSKTVNDVQFPDVRICTKPFPKPLFILGSRGFLVAQSQSDKLTQEEFSELTQVEYLDRKTLHYPYTLTSANGETDCWLFTTPNGFKIDNKDGGNKGIRFFFGGYSLVDPNKSSDARIQIELYAPGRDPNLPIYHFDDENQTLTKDEIGRWSEGDLADAKSPTKYTVDYTAYTTIGYQITKRRYLTSNGWNYMGFLQKFNDINELSTSIQTLDGNADELFSTIDIYPLTMTEITVQEQNVHTLLNVLGTVGGLYSLLVAADSLLFGTRPKSPWGIIQRFSILGANASLHNSLYNAFGFLDRPIPYIDPVHKRFDESNTDHIKSEDGHSGVASTVNNSINDTEQQKMIDDAFRQRTEKEMQDLQRRLQLMESIFKAYYINEEVFHNLNAAHDKIEHIDSTEEGKPGLFAKLRRRKNNSRTPPASDHERMLQSTTYND